MAFCKYCGSKIASNEDFCEECKNDTDALFAAAKHFHSREIYKLSMKVKKSKDLWKEGLESLNKKDYTTAFFKFAAAANKDYSNAQLELGNLLFEGKGCTKNTSSAFYWYEKAGKAGNTDALKKLKELNRGSIQKQIIVSQQKASFKKVYAVQKETNLNIISELIKSMILSEPNPKDIYTIPYIQEYFLKFYKKDIENMITRDLLIKTCGELYAEENMYYFVESTTNSFLLCRAKNRADWREYGLGTVYIPTISVNDKKIDIRNFVLHVYDSLLNVKHNRTQHNVESVTIKALNAQGTIITFNAFYCHSCNEYYTTRENIILNRYPLIRFNFHSRQAYERREESELMMYGYTVKEGELSANQRQNLLARLITFGFLDKFYITGFIKYLINNNGRRANMKSAVEKWQSDLEFVQNFNIGTQRTVYVEDMKIKYRGSYVNKEILNNNYTSYQSKTIDDIMYERAKESGWEL